MDDQVDRTTEQELRRHLSARLDRVPVRSTPRFTRPGTGWLSRGATVPIVMLLMLAAIVGGVTLGDWREQRAGAPAPEASPSVSPATAVPTTPSPPASAPVSHENPILGYRITLPEGYRRSGSAIVTGHPELLGHDAYTLLSEAEERAECLRDAGHIPSPASAAYLYVEAYRNVRGVSVVEWVNTPFEPGGQSRSTHRTVEPVTVDGREAVRLVQQGETHVYVISANDRMYVLTPTMWPSQHPLDDIVTSFRVIAPRPFPTPTAASTKSPREAASELGRALAEAFAARDADAVARLMPECWFGVVYAIDGSVPGQGPLNRSVFLFTQALRDRFAAGDLTVTVDPTPQVTTEGGRDEYFVRSEWREPDRTVRVDLMLQERDGRWLWASARHHYGAADRSCIPYRSPWVSGNGSC